jgi:hypothetical protein
MLEPGKKVTSPFLYHLNFIVRLARGAFYHGIKARRSRVRDSATHIPLRVIIPTYRSLYGGAHVAQTSGGGALAGT